MSPLLDRVSNFALGMLAGGLLAWMMQPRYSVQAYEGGTVLIRLNHRTGETSWTTTMSPWHHIRESEKDERK